MRKSIIYMTIGLLAVSAFLTSGAMANGAVPEMRSTLMAADNSISVEYAEEAVFFPEEDFSNIIVKPGYWNMQLEPGESKDLKVVVINRGEEAVSIDPTLVIQPHTENFLKDEWVTITPSTAELAAYGQDDAKKEFTVKVEVPKDAEMGYYNAFIAFEEFDAENAPTAAYSSSLEMSIEVRGTPSIHIVKSSINDRVESGKSYDYEIELKNTGDKDISINPELIWDEIYYDRMAYGGSEEVLDETAVTISAPSSVKAGQTATVKVHLDVPEGAQGSFSSSIDLGIDDPALRDWEKKVHMYFTVWEQPSEAYVKEFTTSFDGTIRIELSANSNSFYDGTGSDQASPSFDVTLENSDGKADIRLVKSCTKGYVNYGSEPAAPWESYASFGYHDSGSVYTEVYEVSGEAGEWVLSVLPVNTENFDYNIIVEE
ncbi:hypothetical protein V7O66_09835 [Methanolobus sp. ZRKC3]|uniref:COG1470 family protein n=1 Tax=Methanolobus sp. ZRKC3 TaxID=3125786 RepID=UPI003249A712